MSTRRQPLTFHVMQRCQRLAYSCRELHVASIVMNNICFSPAFDSRLATRTMDVFPFFSAEKLDQMSRFQTKTTYSLRVYGFTFKQQQLPIQSQVLCWISNSICISLSFFQHLRARSLAYHFLSQCRNIPHMVLGYLQEGIQLDIFFFNHHLPVFTTTVAAAISFDWCFKLCH